ncbi:MAG: hypothetical protein H0V53_10190 [Rubrobacter sp.]|nr:hypothetical protein [Rubrobacter sp.]
MVLEAGAEPRGRPLTRSSAPPRYVIARRENGGLEVLVSSGGPAGSTMPVFLSETSARQFLLSNVPESGWYVRSTSAGELISLLLGPCIGVSRVLTDTAGDTGLVSRRSYVDSLVGAPAFSSC